MFILQTVWDLRFGQGDGNIHFPICNCISIYICISTCICESSLRNVYFTNWLGVRFQAGRWEAIYSLSYLQGRRASLQHRSLRCTSSMQYLSKTKRWKQRRCWEADHPLAWPALALFFWIQISPTLLPPLSLPQIGGADNEVRVMDWSSINIKPSNSNQTFGHRLWMFRRQFG